MLPWPGVVISTRVSLLGAMDGAVTNGAAHDASGAGARPAETAQHLADAYHVRVFDIVPHGELVVVNAVIERDLCQRLAALDGVQLRRSHFGLARCRRGWRRRGAKWWRRSFLHRGRRSRHAAD